MSHRHTLSLNVNRTPISDDGISCQEIYEMKTIHNIHNISFRRAFVNVKGNQKNPNISERTLLQTVHFLHIGIII